LVCKIIDAGVGVVNKSNHEYLELEGTVRTEEGGTVCTGRVGIEEATGYQSPNSWTVCTSLSCSIDGMQLTMGELLVG
jgi:hypothetical protein